MLFGLFLTLGVAVLSIALRSFQNSYSQRAGALGILVASFLAIYFITGSLMPGEEWATEEQHKALWLSRGRDNPNPARFTEEVMTLDGVKLYDLLQFGADGCASYRQLYMGPEPAPLRYCLLTDSQTMEDRCQTFSEALEKIIAFELGDTEE